MAGESIDPLCRHSAWQRTELWRMDLDSGMTEMEFMTGADRNTGDTQMDCATGSIYPEVPGVDSTTSNLNNLIMQ